MNRLLQYGLALTFGILFLLTGFSDDTINSFCLFLILIFGIPHGAVDHKIHLTTSSENSVLRYILKYLLIASGYILWWIFDPTKALFIFILLSAYHFGQELLEDSSVKNSSLLTRMIWGATILIAPMIYKLAEIAPYLEVITGASISNIGPVRIILPSIIVITALSSMIFFWQKGYATKKALFRLSSFLLFVVLSQMILPFVQAFTLYFVLFHSLNAFRHQYSWLKERNSNYNVGRFFTDLLGFSLLAIFGILMLLWFFKPESQTSLITYFFILVSLITLPHAITLDQFYKFRSKPSLSNSVN